MRLSSTAPADCGNAAVANRLPPYHGFRHQVQPRNAQLATAVEIFFRTGDIDALRAFGKSRTSREQTMLLAYLVANTFMRAALELGEAWALSPCLVLASLNRRDAREIGKVFGWAGG